MQFKCGFLTMGIFYFRICNFRYIFIVLYVNIIILYFLFFFMLRVQYYKFLWLFFTHWLNKPFHSILFYSILFYYIIFVYMKASYSLQLNFTIYCQPCRTTKHANQLQHINHHYSTKFDTQHKAYQIQGTPSRPLGWRWRWCDPPCLQRLASPLMPVTPVASPESQASTPGGSIWTWPYWAVCPALRLSRGCVPPSGLGVVSGCCQAGDGEVVMVVLEGYGGDKVES